MNDRYKITPFRFTAFTPEREAYLTAVMLGGHVQLSFPTAQKPTAEIEVEDLIALGEWGVVARNILLPRRTGKTTRMLVDASLSKQRDFWIICRSNSFIPQLANQFAKIVAEQNPTVGRLTNFVLFGKDQASQRTAFFASLESRATPYNRWKDPVFVDNSTHLVSTIDELERLEMWAEWSARTVSRSLGTNNGVDADKLATMGPPRRRCG
jgi:hypothetical protein